MKTISMMVALLWAGSGAYAQGTIQVAFTDLESNEGQVYVCLFDQEEGFPGLKKATMVEKVAVNDKQARHIFSDLPLGTYAISVMHDENGDGEIKRNWMGIPKEKVGISKMSKSRSRPSFDKAKFTLTTAQPDHVLTITPFN